MTAFPHAFPIEFGQLILAFIGVVFSLWALWDAVKDKQALDVAGINGARRTLVRSNVRSEVAQVLVFVAFVVSGTFGVLLPPPFVFTGDELSTIERFLNDTEFAAKASREQQTNIMAARFAMIFVTVVLMWRTIMERRDRIRYSRYARSGGKERRIGQHDNDEFGPERRTE